MRPLLLVVVLAISGCANQQETRASRERLNCIYAAQYEGDFTPAERKKLEESCSL